MTFLELPWVGMKFVSVAFPGHTHFLCRLLSMKAINYVVFMNYTPAMFEAAMSVGLGGNAFTRNI